MKAVGAVDIGGTKIAVGIVDESGRLLCRFECPTEGCGPYSSALQRITAMLRDAVQRCAVDIAGIGIGSTGPVYPFTGEFGDVNFFPHWRGESLVRDLEKEFHVSAAIENDADAAALAEAGWGAGQRKSRLGYVTVGTGLGIVIILLPSNLNIISRSYRIVHYDKTELAMASLGDDTNLIGAGRVWFYRFATAARSI